MRSVSGRGIGRPRVVVTAGPTREKIDPIRFISNCSTGVFGYEIAEEAARRGCRVTLISGPTNLAAPRGVKTINVESAAEMKRATEQASKRADCLIMAAAVSDWRARFPSTKKLKRGAGGKTLELVENPDILAGIGKKRHKGLCLVGFALETDRLEKNAISKMKAKGLDMIVANRASARPGPFGYNNINIAIFDRVGRRLRVRGVNKRKAAKIILDRAFSFNI